MLVMVTVISTTAIVLAVAATLAVGDPRSALPPALYLTGSLLGLAHLATSKRVEVRGAAIGSVRKRRTIVGRRRAGDGHGRRTGQALTVP